MKPLKGLNTDVLAPNNRPGELRYAKNIVYDKNGSLSNEKGFDSKVPYPIEVVVNQVTYYYGQTQNLVGVIETPYEYSILFYHFSDTNVDVIGKFDGSTFTPIIATGIDDAGNTSGDSFLKLDFF